jgi:hypothetical protein
MAAPVRAKKHFICAGTKISSSTFSSHGQRCLFPAVHCRPFPQLLFSGLSVARATTLGYLAPVLPPEALAEYKAALVLVRLDGALARMAKSRYEYVKFFEKDDSLLQNTWIVVRIDGRGFHGYSDLPCGCPAVLLTDVDSPGRTTLTSPTTSMLSIS